MLFYNVVVLMAFHGSARDPRAALGLVRSLPPRLQQEQNEMMKTDATTSFDFSNTTGFQGARVNALRKRQREEKGLPDAATMFSRFKERPGTFILISLFLLLTVGDFIFNVSRQFICLLPDLCAPAQY